MVEKLFDAMKFSFKGNLEAIREITPITNMEEFSLGYVAGWIRKTSENVVFLSEGETTKKDEKEIQEIIMRRLPEMRKKIMQYLNR